MKVERYRRPRNSFMYACEECGMHPNIITHISIGEYNKKWLFLCDRCLRRIIKRVDFSTEI